MVSAGNSIDFYIFSFDPVAVERTNWLVCAKPTSHCLGVHGELEAAVAQARQMAEYRVIAGQAAQIHVKQKDGISWKTVWCSDGVAPKFPVGEL